MTINPSDFLKNAAEFGLYPSHGGGGGGVNSVTGTTNQVIATGSTNVVLSLPQNIAASSTPIFENVQVAYNVTTTSGTGVNLTESGAYYQDFVGTISQTVYLPNITSFSQAGWSVLINNQSTQTMTINGSDALIIGQVPPNSAVIFTCTAITGLSNDAWNSITIQNSSEIYSVTGTADQVIAETTGGNVILSLPQNIATSSNPKFNNLIRGYQTTAMVGGEISMSSPYAYYQQLTGTVASIFVLPNTSALSVGYPFYIKNDSTANQNIFASNGASITVINPNSTLLLNCISTSITTPSAWDFTYLPNFSYPLSSIYGGTGVNNGGKTLTLGGNYSLLGNFNVSLIATANTSVTLPTSGTLLALDVNNNLSANNFLSAGQQITTSGGTTILTVSSPEYTYFSGTSAQVVQMPVTSALKLYQSYTVSNSTTDSILINSSGGNLIQTMSANSVAILTCINTASTTASAWAVQYISTPVLSVTPQQVQSSAFNFGVDSGVADAYVVTLNPASASYYDGMWILFNPLNNNTTSVPTIQVDGLGTLTLILANDQPLLANDLENTSLAIVYYSAAAGTAVLLNPQVSTINVTDLQTNYFTFSPAARAIGFDDNYNMSLPTITTISDGFNASFYPSLTNTSSVVTMSVNGNQYPIVDVLGSNLIPGSLINNQTYNFNYNSSISSYVVQNPSAMDHMIYNTVWLNNGINDANGNTALVVTGQGSAVNSINLSNAPAGQSPFFQATGSDANILLELKGQGNAGAQIQGNSAGTTSLAGNVGEVIKVNIPSASAITIANATSKDLTSHALTAGSYMVFGNISFVATTGTITLYEGWINTASATFVDQSTYAGANTTALTYVGLTVPPRIISLSAAGTVYLSAFIQTAGTVKMSGNLTIVRI